MGADVLALAAPRRGSAEVVAAATALELVEVAAHPGGSRFRRYLGIMKKPQVRLSSSDLGRELVEVDAMANDVVLEVVGPGPG